MELEKLISDALAAAEALFSTIHLRLQSSRPLIGDEVPLSTPSYVETKSLLRQLCLLSGTLRALGMHAHTLPTSERATTAQQKFPSVDNDSNFSSRPMPSQVCHGEPEFDLVHLRRWIAELKRLHAKFSSISDSIDSSTAQENATSPEWPVPVGETQRVCEFITQANNLATQLILKTDTLRSLLTLLSGPHETLPDQQPSTAPRAQLRSLFEDGNLHDTIHKVHPKADAIAATAITWIAELDSDCQITAPQLCSALSLHLCPDAHSLAEVRPIMEHQLLEICGEVLRTDSSGILTIACNEWSEGDIPAHLQTDIESLAHVSLRMLNFEEFNEPLKEATILEQQQTERSGKYPLYLWAAQYLLDILHRIDSPWSAETRRLAFQLFSREKSKALTQFIHQLYRRRFSKEFEGFGVVKYHAVKELSDLLTSSDLSTLHLAACLRLPEVCENLIETGEDPDLPSPIGTPFYCALVGPRNLILQGETISMRVVSDDPWSIKSMETAKVIRRQLRSSPNGAAGDKGGFASVVLLASACTEDVDFFKSVMPTVNKDSPYPRLSLYISSMCRALDDPSLMTWMSPGGLSGKNSLSRRKCINAICEHLIDDTALTILQEEFPETSRLRALERSIWQFATSLDLSCADPGCPRPLSTLDDSEFDKMLLQAVMGNEVLLLSLKRLIQDPRCSSAIESQVNFYNGETLLHQAAARKNVELLELLLTHTNMALSEADLEGQTAIHRCDSPNVLSVLLRYDADLSVPDDEGRTLWHLAAANNDRPLLEALLQLDPAKNEALSVRNKHGSTPFAEALLYVRELADQRYSDKSREKIEKCMSSVMLLAEHVYQKPECWASSTSLVHLAAEWGVPWLVEKLHAIGYRAGEDDTVVDGSSPLHSLNMSASKRLVKLLQPGSYLYRTTASFPVLNSDQLSPAETIFFNFKPSINEDDRTAHPSHSQILDELAYAQLLSVEVVESRDKDGKTLWERFLAKILGSLSRRSETWKLIGPSILKALQCMFDARVTDFHERVTNQCALIPFLPILPKMMVNARPTASLKAEVVQLARRIVVRTTLLRSVAQQTEIAGFLTWAISARRGAEQQTDRDCREICMTLLKNGVSAHALDATQFSPLVTACIEPSISRRDLQLILGYVRADEVNKASHNGCTALELLCLNGDISRSNGTPLPDFEHRIQSLVRAGADVNVRTSDGVPLVLYLAEENRMLPAQVLIDCGADIVSARSDDGQDVAIAAARHGSIQFLEWLRKRAIPGFAWDNTCTLERRIHARRSSRHGVQSISGCTGLHIAALSGSLSAVKFYLANRFADADCRCQERQLTPLHFAALGGHMEVIGHLAASGADLMAKDVNGATPLFYAVWGQQPGSVRKLLSLGVLPEHTDFHSRTPLSEAIEDGHSEVRGLLAQAVRASGLA